jgi:PKD domain-containing protein
MNRRSLPVLVGLALTAGAVSIASPAHADDPVNTPPTASYALDSTAIWAGQRVTLTESGVTDDTTAPDAITRTVAWGDGTTEQLAVGRPTGAHVYPTVGSYQITVTLNDGTADGAGVFSTGSAVTVTTAPGTYAWQKSPIYVSPGYQEQGVLLASGLPTATRVWSTWGDGETSLLKDGTSAKVGHWFGFGPHTPKITLQNGQDRATPRATDQLTVLEDTTAPTASLTIPSTPSKAASWATIRGKAYDSEAGVDVVGLQLFKWNSTTGYYYNFTTRTWVKDTGAALPYAAQALLPTDASNNWSAGVAGLSKGYTLQVVWYVWDKVGNLSDDYWQNFALTS